MQALLKAVTGSTPDQLLFDFALWSSRTVVAYVVKKFKKRIFRRTARRYLRRLGFTYQCSVRRAREQNPAAMLHSTYPRIKAEAKLDSARVLWADEAAVQVGGIKPRDYSERGRPPVLHATAKRSARRNMISAVCNKGDLMFMVYDGSMNVDVFKQFFTQVVKEGGRSR